MRVLAIDPGYDRLGVAVLEQTNGKEALLYSNCVVTKRIDPFEKRLVALGDEFLNIIAAHKPDTFAIERVYFNVNQKSAIAVAEVRGMLIYLAEGAGLAIHEYGPQEVKMAITGYGKGGKMQVAEMVKRLVEINKEIVYDDEYDAIAVGLTCCAARTSAYPQK